jgi:peptidoglycan/xylan/chitin deacetylase (PgdA/CDA1 family)
MSKVEMAANAWRTLGVGARNPLAGRWRGLLVLNYHRIGDAAATAFDADLFSATAEDFDAQMAFLARDFDVITLQDLPLARRDPRGRYVMVTFDDGYRDNYELAFPILRRHRIPGTFFIATGFIDQPQLAWWDRIAWQIGSCRLSELPSSDWWGGPFPLSDPASRTLATRAVLAAYKRTSTARTPQLLAHLTAVTGAELTPELAEGMWMTWNHLRELRLAGMGIGGHTHTHPILSQLPPAGQVDEVRRCRERLYEMAGVRTRGFAYPVGHRGAYTTMTRAILIANGFDFAFGFWGGYQTMTEIDFLDIRRTHVGRYMSQERFEAIVTLPQIFAR